MNFFLSCCKFQSPCRLIQLIPVFLAFTILLFEDIYPQAASSDDLVFDVDYSRFRASADMVYLEVYYSIPRFQLQFIEEGNQFEAIFMIKTEIYKNDSLAIADSIINITTVDSLSQVTKSQNLLNLTGFAIQEGDYKIEVSLKDMTSKRIGRQSLDLRILPYREAELSISDIQLSSSINLNKEQPDKFTKNHYRIIPNPGRMYGLETPMLYFYAEVYNLDNQVGDKQYRVKSSIHNANGDEIRTLQEKVKEKPGASSVEVVGFNIVSLKSNTYVLQLEVEDLATGSKTKRTKKFFVYREGDYQPNMLANQFNKDALLNSFEYKFYDELNESEINTEFLTAKYLATKEEVSIYDGLDLQGKRVFMKSFWFARDQDLSTLQNEFRQQYLNNLNYVNSYFGSGKPGWKSERGRVYLLYGKPDEVERHPSTLENKGYEVWNYFQIQGGIFFVFVDNRGFGEYIMVHSTARNELHDFDWQRWLSE